jgi:HEAT repeat protein
VPSPEEHQRIRDLEDRSWTFRLLEEVRAESTNPGERSEAFRTLGYLEDYRSIEPLTEMVENADLSTDLREEASVVLSGFDLTSSEQTRRLWWSSGDAPLMKHALRLMERSEADVVTSVAGDNSHPWQGLALSTMAFGFDEPEFQPLRIDALTHRDPQVRASAANVLVWDEPVAAEAPLLQSMRDESTAVAIEAVRTLEYYPSRQVLREISEMTGAATDELRMAVSTSLDSLRESFEAAASNGGEEEVRWMRDWMEPVADLLTLTDEWRSVEEHGAPSPPSRVRYSLDEILRVADDADGEWAVNRQILLEVDWELCDDAARAELSSELAGHPDPLVREAAAVALSTWGQSEELAVLTGDSHFAVRKAAIYHLGLLPRDPELAAVAWDYLSDAAGTTASEALTTYATHASRDEAKGRLTALASDARSESLRHSAISNLVTLGGSSEIASLNHLLREAPPVTWTLHIALLNAIRKLGLPEPDVPDLFEIDNLHLAQSLAALRFARS